MWTRERERGRKSETWEGVTGLYSAENSRTNLVKVIFHNVSMMLCSCAYKDWRKTTHTHAHAHTCDTPTQAHTHVHSYASPTFTYSCILHLPQDHCRLRSWNEMHTSGQRSVLSRQTASVSLRMLVSFSAVYINHILKCKMHSKITI